MTHIQLPEHQNPNQARAAHAPYNFVPLPDVIVKAVERPEDLPDHKSYTNVGYSRSGYFDVKLTTLSPLYVRGGLSTAKPNENTLSEYERAEAERSKAPADFRQAIKNKPDFFHVHDLEKPAIPGSSLRGMLRQLLEIVTYSKVQWTMDKQLVYRAVGDRSTLGSDYRERLLGTNKTNPPDMHFNYPSPLVKGGYLKRTNNGWAIQPAKEWLGESFVRVEYRDARPIIGHHGRWRVHTVYVEPARRISRNRGRRGNGNLTLDVAITREVSDTPDRAGRLKLAKLIESGHMGGGHAKHWHCAIYEPDLSAKQIPIPEEMWNIYQEDRDMTRGQLKTIPIRNDGDPLFYLVDNSNELVYFGSTVMFRLPYRKSPLDLIPESLRRPEEIDFAEALFGYVRTSAELDSMARRGLEKPKQGRKGRAYAGRVSITDATLDDEQTDIWLPVNTPDGILEPSILASPKPTSFQHYLTQQSPDDRRALDHYDKSQTTIRGMKLYWPKGRRDAEDLRAKFPKEDPENVPQQMANQFEWDDENEQWRVVSSNTQHTRMKPVKDGVSFTFRVYFDNLSDVELGALQWILKLPEEPEITYCHRLGMGKPLGMGAVQLEPTLYLFDRPTRYSSLFKGNTWNNGEDEEAQRVDFQNKFEKYILSHLSPSTRTGTLRQVKRIQMLLKMLTWQDDPLDLDLKRYISELGTFRDRAVLPDPLNLNGTGQSTQNTARNRPDNRPPARDGERARRTAPNQVSADPPPQQATSVRTAAPFTLAEGVVIRGKVLSIKEGNVEFDPDERYLTGVPGAKGVDASIPKDRVGGKQYQVGFPVVAVIEAIEESRDDLILRCRPATKEESKKGRA